jgi:hypothetical protein
MRTALDCDIDYFVHVKFGIYFPEVNFKLLGFIIFSLNYVNNLSRIAEKRFPKMLRRTMSIKKKTIVWSSKTKLLFKRIKAHIFGFYWFVILITVVISHNFTQSFRFCSLAIFTYLKEQVLVEKIVIYMHVSLSALG